MNVMILDFEWNVKELIILHRLKNIKIIFFVVLLIKSFTLMINLLNQLFFSEEKYRLQIH